MYVILQISSNEEGHRLLVNLEWKGSSSPVAPLALNTNSEDPPCGKVAWPVRSELPPLGNKVKSGVNCCGKWGESGAG